jgi:chloramphenicol-sensitive protein RarD
LDDREDPRTDAPAPARAGLAYGLAAFVSWGFIPLYFHALQGVAPEEILAHRVVWSTAVLVGFLAWRGRLRELAGVLRMPRTLGALALSTSLIVVNWYLFIWAVGNARVVDASLGYYINPLVNVLLGALVLRERLSPAQKVAVGLALAGVGFQVATLGTVPVLGLVLATSFGLYGLVRKTVAVDAPVGLAAETLLALPVAAGYLAWRAAAGTLSFGTGDARLTALLLAAGPVTALPLLWFVHAARRLRYATVGLLQYVAPTLQFTLAVAAFGEAFNPRRLVTFGLVWSGLAIYSWDSLRAARRAL